MTKQSDKKKKRPFWHVSSSEYNCVRCFICKSDHKLNPSLFIRAKTFCLESEICCCYHWLCPRIINVWHQVQFHSVTVTEINLVWSLAFSLGKLIPNDAAGLKNWEFKFIFSAGWRRMHIYNTNSKLSTFWLPVFYYLLPVAKLHALSNIISKGFLHFFELSYPRVNSPATEFDKGIFSCFL